MRSGRKSVDQFRGFLAVAILGYLVGSLNCASAGQVTVMAAEVQAQRAGQILTVSSQFRAMNHGDEPVMGVAVVGSDGSMVPIGDIPPRGEVMSAPLVFSVDLGGFNGRHLAFPVTVQYFEGQSGQLTSAHASFSCQIPEE